MSAYTKEELLAYAEEVKEEQLELLRTLGKIAAPSHQEDKRAAFVKNWMIEQGFENVCIDEAKNVIAEMGPDTEEISVMEAHTDVVFPDLDVLEMHEDEEKLYAPGIGDDTANLVNLLYAARFVLRNGIALKKKTLIVANSCEEGLGNLDGTKNIFRTYGNRITEFVSLDGSMGGLCDGAVGSYRYKISCDVQGGHSYGDFPRPNAIAVLASLIEKLYAIEVPTQARTTFNVGCIEGGTTVNSIAQHCEMLYEYRSPSQECLKIMEGKFNEAVEAVKACGEKITVEVLGIRPGNGDLDEEEMKAYTGERLDVIRKYVDGEISVHAGSTDANIPLSMGIKACTIGTVVGKGAHTREEWIEKASMTPGLALALDLLLLTAE